MLVVCFITVNYIYYVVSNILLEHIFWFISLGTEFLGMRLPFDFSVSEPDFFAGDDPGALNLENILEKKLWGTRETGMITRLKEVGEEPIQDDDSNNRTICPDQSSLLLLLPDAVPEQFTK